MQSITETIKISHKKIDVGKKNISFLKELKTGYLPMDLSQFRYFSKKLTFFEGWGGLNDRSGIELFIP